MSHIFWELKEVAIPQGAHLNEGKVYLQRRRTDVAGQYKYKRQVIGHATSNSMMHPNELFRSLYPDVWQQNYGKSSLKPNEVSCGLYAVSLAFLQKTGLYSSLIDAYGPKFANAIVDFALYSIKFISDSASNYYGKMQNQLLFSNQIFSDSWYSNFFKHDIKENSSINFRKNWLKKCSDNGITDAWISIDGSNNKCRISSSDLVENGFTKFCENSDIVSFIYAIDAETGKPLTYNVNPGATVDCKAIIKIVEELVTNLIL